jgi:surface protein
MKDWCAGGARKAVAVATYGEIENWDVSRVTDMSRLFVTQGWMGDEAIEGAATCNPQIGDWDTAAVTNMAGMFTQAPAFSQDIGKWKTAKVTDMSWMFAHASAFNQDISKWDTAKVTDMTWDTAAVTDMAGMFISASPFNQDIGDWDTTKVINMNTMFAYASAFNQKLCWDRTGKYVDSIFQSAGCSRGSCWGTGT